jgi:hypothetical protein
VVEQTTEETCDWLMEMSIVTVFACWLCCFCGFEVFDYNTRGKESTVQASWKKL